jgi:hypothetical protein
VVPADHVLDREQLVGKGVILLEFALHLQLQLETVHLLWASVVGQDNQANVALAKLPQRYGPCVAVDQHALLGYNAWLALPFLCEVVTECGIVLGSGEDR